MELGKHTLIIERLLEIAAETDLNFDEREHSPCIIVFLLWSMSGVIPENCRGLELVLWADFWLRVVGHLAEVFSGILKEENPAIDITVEKVVRRQILTHRGYLHKHFDLLQFLQIISLLALHNFSLVCIVFSILCVLQSDWLRSHMWVCWPLDVLTVLNSKNVTRYWLQHWNTIPATQYCTIETVVLLIFPFLQTVRYHTIRYCVFNVQ